MIDVKNYIMMLEKHEYSRIEIIFAANYMHYEDALSKKDCEFLCILKIDANLKQGKNFKFLDIFDYLKNSNYIPEKLEPNHRCLIKFFINKKEIFYIGASHGYGSVFIFYENKYWHILRPDWFSTWIKEATIDSLKESMSPFMKLPKKR